MKKSNQNGLIIVSLTVVICLALIFGVYIRYFRNNQSDYRDFQSLISKNCNVATAKIDAKTIPIKFVWESLKSIGVESSLDKFNCWKYGDEVGYAVGVPLAGNDSNSLVVYSVHTLASAFGGTPDPDVIGIEIKKDETIKIVVQLQIGEGPAIIGDLPVVVLGEKKISLTNGEVLYASYRTTAIQSDDLRLVKLLTKYSKPYFKDQKELISTTDRNKLVKDAFFSDINKLGTNEKKAYDEVMTVLNAVSAR